MNLKELPIDTIKAIMDCLPVDISFIDENDVLKFFNSPKTGRIFPRTKMDIGRKVQNCHPPKSVHIVNKILRAFKDGKRDEAPFWITLNEKLIYINYFPVFDKDGKYLGTVEASQDITKYKKIAGNNRLLDWKDE